MYLEGVELVITILAVFLSNCPIFTDSVWLNLKSLLRIAGFTIAFGISKATLDGLDKCIGFVTVNEPKPVITTLLFLNVKLSI